jgi:hypothetical protein
LKGNKGIKGNNSATGVPGVKGDKGPAGPSSCYGIDFCCAEDTEQACACEAGTTTLYQTVSSFNPLLPVYDSGCTSCDGTGECPFMAIGGNAYEWFNGDCIAYYQGNCKSDSTLKYGVKTLENSLSNILQMTPVEYDWNETSPNFQQRLEQGKIHDIGFIAQEVQKFYPEVITIRPDGYLGMDYNKINAILVEGIKEHQELLDQINIDIQYLSVNI